MRSRIFIGVCVAALIGYAAWLSFRCSSEPGGADASGYLNRARLLTEGKLATELRMVPELAHEWPRDFEPLGFEAEVPRARLLPRYPIGLPLHLAVACSVAGWQWGPMILEVGGALAALVMCYLVTRELGVTPVLAALASASLAVCDVFIYTSVQPFSDTLATFWCAAAVWAALRSRSRGRVWAASCGFAFSVAVLVRPTDALLLPALIIFLGQRKNWMVAALAGLPLAAILALDNYLLYGGPLRSGYGKLSDLFSVAYFWPSVGHFSIWLVRVLPLGLFALPAVVLLAGGKPRWPVAGLVVWAAAFGFCYSFYSFSPQDWSFFRFVEPAFPALLALACLGLQALVDRLPEPARARRAGLIAAGALGVTTLTNLSFHVPDARKHDRKYVEAAAWVQKNAPPSAILLSWLFSGTLYFRTAHAILRWEMPSARDEAGYLATLNKTGRPVYAVLDASEVADFFLKNNASGKWEQMIELGDASIWRLTPGGSR